MLFQQLAVAAGIGLVTTTVALAVSRPILLGSGVMDVPNHRSSHVTPTVRAGGIGITVGLLSALSYGSVMNRTAGNGLLLFTVVVVSIAVLGLVEDIHGLSVRMRIVGQALLGSLLAGGLFHNWDLPQRVLAALIGLAAMVFYVNAANFMDGINTISSLHGLIAGIYYCLIAAYLDVSSLAVAGTSVALCFIMFLPWNAPRARMFMGDVGSYALGGAVVGMGMWVVSLGGPVVTSIAPMSIYALDVLRTLAIRYQEGKSLVVAHRDHVYQQLQRLLGAHSVASLITSLATVGCCVAGIVALIRPPLVIPAVCSAVVLGGAYLASPRIVSKVTGKEITA